MHPLKPLEQPSAGAEQSVVALLKASPASVVAHALEKLEAAPEEALAAAARVHAVGMLALRTGDLSRAQTSFEDAAERFAALGEAEAAMLSRCEGWLAVIRQGPRDKHQAACDALSDIAGEASHPRVKVVATHYQATALRFLGRAEATLGVLLEAFALSDGMLAERAQLLNSLGTLYVVLGAYGAAQSVLSHAAELNHQIGDRVSEAISYGQLGSAALARGELDVARRHLQRQEWYASQVGDTFGQARALALLAELALEYGRPDDAAELGERALDLAGRVKPPLSIWQAYGTRVVARAKLELGLPGGEELLREAMGRFEDMGNQLGKALVAWDLTQARQQRAGAAAAIDPGWHDVAHALASLGLSGRVAQLLMDLRGQLQDGRQARMVDFAVAAVGQSYPHLASAQEVALVLTDPNTVAEIATRRIGGQRNLGRLGAHCIADGGLFVAVVAAKAIGAGALVVPSQRSAATLLGQLPGLAMISWSADCPVTVVARDLSALRASLGGDTRAALAWYATARVVRVPFAGELGVEVIGAELGGLAVTALAMAPGALRVLGAIAWDGEAEALVRMSGFYRS